MKKMIFRCFHSNSHVTESSKEQTIDTTESMLHDFRNNFARHTSRTHAPEERATGFSFLLCHIGSSIQHPNVVVTNGSDKHTDTDGACDVESGKLRAALFYCLPLFVCGDKTARRETETTERERDCAHQKYRYGRKKIIKVVS